MNSGIHLIHKPVGPTSFTMVRECMGNSRKKSGAPIKVCHGGALDPFASGLLLLLVGPATRLFDYLHSIPKVYEATIRWGVETDNGDPFGNVVLEGDASHLSSSQLDAALASFVGWHDQIPPPTSNKRIDGERAYVKAHRGEVFTLPPSRVYLHEARWLEHLDINGEQSSRLRIVVRGGYYARSLARDLGRLLGCGAHLSALRRVSIGPWNDPGPNQRIEVAGPQLLSWALRRELGEAEMIALKNNQPIGQGEIASPDWNPPGDFPELNAPIRGVHLGRLVYLLEMKDDHLRPIVWFPGGI